jgi:aspartate kinase
MSPVNSSTSRKARRSAASAHDEDRLRRDLAQRFPTDATLVDGLGAVSVVGAGINASYVNVRRGSHALQQAGISPQGLATSSFRITWLVSRDSIAEAARRLHETFLEPVQ